MTRKLFYLIALTLIGCLSPILCNPIYAQSTSATITGFVNDQSKAAIVGVKVDAINTDTNTHYVTTTNSDGNYTIPNLPPGNYKIEVEKSGFKSIAKPDVVLHLQDVAAFNFVLAVGSISEVITVQGGGININTTDGAVSTVVDQNFVQNIPLNGRSFQSLITLAPGVVTAPGAGVGEHGEFSVNGQRTEENYYTVDGVSANSGSNPYNFDSPGNNLGASGSVPGLSALGTTQSLITVDAMQEFRIQTSTYSAEYGRTPGAQIAFVSRSGTNDWHGSAFEYLRNDALDANNWFANNAGLPRQAERQNDFGGTLGGPVDIPSLYNGRDRTFFFFSYEGLRLKIPGVSDNYQVPDSMLRSMAAPNVQQFVDAYPVPPITTDAPDLISPTYAFSQPSSLDSYSVRVDQRIKDGFNIFGRFVDSPSSAIDQSGVSGDGAAPWNPIALSFNVKTFTLGADNILTSRLANELRFNYTWNTGISNQYLASYQGSVPFTFSGIKDFQGNPVSGLDSFLYEMDFDTGSPVLRIENDQSQQHLYNIVDTMTYSLGAHSLKYGVDFRHIVTPLQFPTMQEQGFYEQVNPFNGTDDVLTGMPVAYRLSSYLNASSMSPVYENTSLFVQDEWKVTSRLTLSLGLRWDLNPPPHDASGMNPHLADQYTNLATTTVDLSNRPLWPTTWFNFAPRFGAAYQLRQSNGWETVLRGGFGVFYDLGNTYASQPYSGIGYRNTELFFSPDFPAPQSQFNALSSVNPLQTPYDADIYAFSPHLQLPYTLEWNVAVQQALGRNQSLTVTYLGSAARRLLLQYSVDPSVVGNPDFPGGTFIHIIENKPTADYDALQVQFQRQLSHGLQVLASYTWAHSLDEQSTNDETSSPQYNGSQLLRGNSSFDIRHSFQAAVTYNVPGHYSSSIAQAILAHWGVESRIFLRSALPVDVSSGPTFDALTGTLVQTRVDIKPGFENGPFYLYGPQYPGGRAINPAAFSIPSATEIANGDFGDSPRNFLRAFGEFQTDLGITREFPIYERLKLQFRAEAFNVFNHPIFGGISSPLAFGSHPNPNFGKAFDTLNVQLGGLNSLYQQGGPRALQLSLRLVF